jgi:tRNA 2-thiouridine synthesizing protein E
MMVDDNALDEEGFVKEPNAWTDELSKKMAKEQFGMSLTDLQMQVIYFVREYYLKWETLPMVKTIRDQFKLDIDQLDDMFKRGKSTARGVICKLGGLPKMLCIASGC